MAAAVTAEKRDPDPAETAHAVGVGRLTERRAHLDPARVLQPVQLVQATAADHADHWLRFPASRASRRPPNAKASSSLAYVRCSSAPVTVTRAWPRASP